MPLPRVRLLSWRIGLALPLLLLVLYGTGAYGLAPQLWRFYEMRHPALDLAERRTRTSTGIPGDPINLGFVGTREQLLAVAEHAGWLPADAITWRSSARIVLASALHKAYVTAPVSDLFMWGHKQDLAFERPYGPDPSKRHHVRFWFSPELNEDGLPLWLGAATFDSQVGVSHLTGQVTHHIDGDLDRERDKLAHDFAQVPGLAQSWLDDFQDQKQGKNGGGDPFHTDGRLLLMRLRDPDSFWDNAHQLLAPVRDFLNPNPTP